jgi:hypothetical protein
MNATPGASRSAAKFAPIILARKCVHSLVHHAYLLVIGNVLTFHAPSPVALLVIIFVTRPRLNVVRRYALVFPVTSPVLVFLSVAILVLPVSLILFLL